jgi:hypothetical protein
MLLLNRYKSIALGNKPLKMPKTRSGDALSFPYQSIAHMNQVMHNTT